jgi:uncharacterized membrane protein
MTDNVAGLLCYVLGLITGVLFLVIEPYNKNPFVRFHAFQSIFLSLAWFAFWIVFSIISAVVFAALPLSLWGLWHLVGMLVGLAVFAIWILLLIKAYQGARFKLPILGDLAEKQAGR